MAVPPGICLRFASPLSRWLSGAESYLGKATSEGPALKVAREQPSLPVSSHAAWSCHLAAAAAFFALSAATMCLNRATHSALVLPTTHSAMRSHLSGPTEAGNLARACGEGCEQGRGEGCEQGRGEGVQRGAERV